MNDLIFISLEPWDHIWRRNQFVCAKLAARRPNMKILFVGPALDVSNRVRSGKFRELGEQVSLHPEGLPNIFVTRPVKLFPNSVSAGRRANEVLQRRHVRKMARKFQLKSPTLWINDHAAHHLAGSLHEAATIYDVTDDWTTLTQSPAVVERIVRQDKSLCGKASAVIVCSERLYEIKTPLAANVHLIPNGVDLDHYAGVTNSALPPAPPAAKWKSPVFGYTGTIHPDRVDVNMLCELAQRMPEATFAMVGPNHLNSEFLAKTARTPNIVFTGPVPYSEIPSYMRAFDVCMTPHRVTPFTESLNPIKLWEYLAAGKPIVSTSVAGFRDFPQLVRLADSTVEFSAALKESLAESPSLYSRRRNEAARHSWDARVDQIEAVIESCTHQKALAHVS